MTANPVIFDYVSAMLDGALGGAAFGLTPDEDCDWEVSDSQAAEPAVADSIRPRSRRQAHTAHCAEEDFAGSVSAPSNAIPISEMWPVLEPTPESSEVEVEPADFAVRPVPEPYVTTSNSTGRSTKGAVTIKVQRPLGRPPSASPRRATAAGRHQASAVMSARAPRSAMDMDLFGTGGDNEDKPHEDLVQALLTGGTSAAVQVSTKACSLPMITPTTPRGQAMDVAGWTGLGLATHHMPRGGAVWRARSPALVL
mmetsp:Transcript_41706/g.75743  ORF Transcript_41706/g.75743 Transcript_41706/m.75743 type:complete len:254 (-) Transcript_41706:53-814(-)